MTMKISERTITLGDLCAGVFAVGSVIVWTVLIVYASCRFAQETLVMVVKM
jgi:hypothetical protein